MNQTQHNKSGSAVALLIMVTLLVSMIGAVAVTGETATLPDGTSLEVSITAPTDGSTFTVQSGETLDLGLSGTASIGAVDQVMTTLIYVVDVSGSVGSPSGGDCGDAATGFHLNSVLDCEAAAILALNDAAIAAGTIDKVGLVLYGEGAAMARVNPAGGNPWITAPDADLNGNGVQDMDEVVESLQPNGIRAFQHLNVGGWTNFEAGLLRTLQLLDQTGPHDRIIVAFLSDGESNRGTSGGVNHKSTQLEQRGADIHTFAIGPDAACTAGTGGTLQQISDATGGDCTPVLEPSDLPDILPGLLSSSLDAVTLSVDGGAAATLGGSDLSVALPAPGSLSTAWTATASGLGPGAHELCATAHGTDPGGSGSVTDCVTVSILVAVPIDIRPGSCPNPFNSKARGVLPVAILGSPDLDVATIDPASIQLAGIAPTRAAIEDVATPHERSVGDPAADDCTEEGGDGHPDLVLKFPNRDLAQALGPVARGDVLVLTLTGAFTEGAGLVGDDIVLVVR